MSEPTVLVYENANFQKFSFEHCAIHSNILKGIDEFLDFFSSNTILKM